MAVDIVSIDYGQAKSLSGEFQNQSAVVKRELQNLDAALAPLRAGGWIAESATAYYKLMDENLMQSIQRLQLALDQTSSTIAEITVDFQNGDTEAAQYFPKA